MRRLVLSNHLARVGGDYSWLGEPRSATLVLLSEPGYRWPPAASCRGSARGDGHARTTVLSVRRSDGSDDRCSTIDICHDRMSAHEVDRKPGMLLKHRSKACMIT